MVGSQDDPYGSWCLRLARRRRRKTWLEKAVQEIWNMCAKKRDVTTQVGGTVYVKYNKESRSEWKVKLYLKFTISLPIE